MTTKLCAGCGIRKEVSEFYEEPSKKNADGLAPYCKQCFADYGLRHERRCSKCREVKPLTREYWHIEPSSKDGFYHMCISCKRQASRQWQLDHPEQHAETKALYKANNKAKIQAYRQEYRERNAERISAYNRWYGATKRKPTSIEVYRAYVSKNRQRIKSYKTQWARNNPHKIKTMTQNRRARKRQAGGSHTSQDIQRIYAEQNGLCAYCGIELGNNYHVDHIMPLIRGGSNSSDNLCCACPKCNLSKGTKTSEEFRAWRKKHGLD